MLLGEILRVALESVRANKLRSFLTALGIIIGIAAVITMVALGEGAQRDVEQRMRTLGTDVLTVRAGQDVRGGVDRGDARLTADEARSLVRSARSVAAASPEMQRRLQVVVGDSNASLSVSGVWPSYFDIQRHRIAAGRLFRDSEERGRRRVAVVGAAVPRTLGLDSGSLVGSTVRIAGVPFEVIGVMVEKGAVGWNNPDDNVFVPLATAQARLFGDDRVSSIVVQAASERQMNAAIAEIDSVLRREHRLRPAELSDFTIRNQTSLLSTFEATTKTFSMLLAGIALVSLLVGGIGIMNIMLVSVTERTREIGVRKALGARRRDILLQFLIEALVLCLVGGLVGVIVGMGAAHAMSRYAGWNTAVAPSSVALAFGFAAVVGVFFGLWPARRAAKMDPIVALRFE